MNSFRLWFLALLVTLTLPVAPAQTPPNVVLIISDDQAWTDYGFMGHPAVQTPNLDRLAAQSRTFPRGYVPSSLCCPSLASIISGLYPHQTRITGNEPPAPAGVAPNQVRAHPVYRREMEKFIALIDDIPTLPRLLGQQGYVSLQTGKWWQGNFARGGFTHGMTHGDPNRGGRHGDEGLKIGREGMQVIFDFIDEADERPFFIWYAPFLPHVPHNPPERLLRKYLPLTDSRLIARYWAMCEWFDETCGQLLDYLEQSGHSENTLVAFVCDNGWIQPADAHRGGWGGDFGKRSPYDGGLRTPMMIRWPGRVEPGLVNTPVSSIDLAPTILEACGLPRDPRMSGVNLLDIEAVRGRAAVFGDVHLHNAVDLNRPAKNVAYRWTVADSRWKLILPDKTNLGKDTAPRGGGAPELYDVIADPFEQVNLAGERPEVVTRLTRMIDGWWPARL